MITFGFAVYKFFQLEFTKAGIMPHAPLIQKTLLGPREFGLVLIGIGLLSILLGAFEQRRDLRALREVYPGLPQSGTRLIALVVGVLGILAFVGVIYRFRAPERVICNFVGIASVPGGEGRISRA